MKAREVSISSGAIAKWLRRQIRIACEVYLFLFEGAGSNPAGVVTACPLFGGRQPVFFSIQASKEHIESRYFRDPRRPWWFLPFLVFLLLSEIPVDTISRRLNIYLCKET